MVGLDKEHVGLTLDRVHSVQAAKFLGSTGRTSIHRDARSCAPKPRPGVDLVLDGPAGLRTFRGEHQRASKLSVAAAGATEPEVRAAADRGQRYRPAPRAARPPCSHR